MEPACCSSRCASSSNNAIKFSQRKRDRLGDPFPFAEQPFVAAADCAGSHLEWVAQVSLLRPGFGSCSWSRSITISAAGGLSSVKLYVQTISVGAGPRVTLRRAGSGSFPDYSRAKDSLTAVRWHTRSSSKNKLIQHPATAGFFVASSLCLRGRNLCLLSIFQMPINGAIYAEK